MSGVRNSTKQNFPFNRTLVTGFSGQIFACTQAAPRKLARSDSVTIPGVLPTYLKRTTKEKEKEKKKKWKK